LYIRNCGDLRRASCFPVKKLYYYTIIQSINNAEVLVQTGGLDINISPKFVFNLPNLLIFIKLN